MSNRKSSEGFSNEAEDFNFSSNIILTFKNSMCEISNPNEEENNNQTQQQKNSFGSIQDNKIPFKVIGEQIIAQTRNHSFHVKRPLRSPPIQSDNFELREGEFYFPQTKRSYKNQPRNGKKQQFYVQRFLTFWRQESWVKNLSDIIKAYLVKNPSIFKDIANKSRLYDKELKKRFQISSRTTQRKKYSKVWLLQKIFNKDQQEFVRQLFQKIKIRYFEIMFSVQYRTPNYHLLPRESKNQNSGNSQSKKRVQCTFLDQTGHKEMETAFDEQFVKVQRQFQQKGWCLNYDQLKEDIVDVIQSNGVQQQRKTIRRLLNKRYKQRQQQPKQNPDYYQKMLNLIQNQESGENDVELNTEYDQAYTETSTFEIIKTYQQTQVTEQILQSQQGQGGAQVQSEQQSQTLSYVEETEEQLPEDDDDDNDDDDVYEEEQSLSIWLQKELQANRQKAKSKKKQMPQQQENDKTDETGSNDSVEETNPQSNPENEESVKSQVEQKLKKSPDEPNPDNNLSQTSEQKQKGKLNEEVEPRSGQV